MSDQIPKQYTIKQPAFLLSVQHDVESLCRYVQCCYHYCHHLITLQQQPI